MKVFQLRVREISAQGLVTNRVIAAGGYTDGSFEIYDKPLGNMFGYWEVD